jgi:hypothetical protein
MCGITFQSSARNHSIAPISMSWRLKALSINKEWTHKRKIYIYISMIR